MRTLGAGAGAEDRGRVPTVVGASAALAAVALGAALILLPLALPVIVTLAGVGLVVVGLATVVGADGTGRHPTSARIAVG
ncbi:hypothetical protein G6016_16795, partial [Dietzia aerolata]|nr:hypothetical protein [Dietzia aerolata]